MNITLRKASALQNGIGDALKGIDFETTIKINEFQEPETEINKAVATLKTNLARRGALTSSLYEIRKAVGQANLGAGVNSRLADVAHLEKEIQFYGSMAGKAVRESEKVVAGKLDKLRNGKDDRRSIYGYSDTVETSVFTTEDLEGFRKLFSAAKKSKQKIQDEILELNIKTEVSLSDATVQILQSEGLL